MVTNFYPNSKLAISAYIFAKTVINLGHVINSIFFYGNGVFNACSNVSKSKNVIDLSKKWSYMYKTFNIKLYVCINSVKKRKLVSRNEKNYSLTKKKSLHKNFFFSGFGVFLKSIDSSDRFIQF